jgi:hypothetical protein
MAKWHPRRGYWKERDKLLEQREKKRNDLWSKCFGSNYDKKNV